MDARPLLVRIARALEETKLDAVLIGNAAAALHGAPVTTLDFDFFFRDTPTNRRKLVAFARFLGAIVLRPYYPASALFRVTDDALTLQADFMGVIHGLRSYEGARKRASTLELDGYSLHVAALEDIVKSKRAANRPKDQAVLPILEAVMREQGTAKKRRPHEG
ncbi:MAG: nucleotidyltransferase [Deltaproteobacteria bacterium]|nr:nucleotidyltransferase [Deltaproteobacteria bacterium]